MKVIIVGLQYFSQILAKELQNKYPEHKFVSINTYYSNKERLRFLYHIVLADIVHSINGTVSKSMVIEFAIRLKKKLIMHWVGTDYVNSKLLFDKGQHIQKYLDYSTHITVSPWFVNDMKNIGIKSKYMALKGFDKKYDAVPFENDFSVLCYINQNRAQFYGMDRIIEIAKQTTNVKYNIVGIESYDCEIPSNVILHGWVDDMEAWIKKSVVCLRLPETDGLSFFVLESIALHRYVAYNLPFEYSDYCLTNEDFINYIKTKKEQFDTNNLSLNSQTAKKIAIAFEQDRVLEKIMSIYQKSLKE